jgi:hypothetical protein
MAIYLIRQVRRRVHTRVIYTVQHYTHFIGTGLVLECSFKLSHGRCMDVLGDIMFWLIQYGLYEITHVMFACMILFYCLILMTCATTWLLVHWLLFICLHMYSFWWVFAALCASIFLDSLSAKPGAVRLPRPIPIEYNCLPARLKVHKIEIFFGFDFEICIISLLVM